MIPTKHHQIKTKHPQLKNEKNSTKRRQPRLPGPSSKRNTTPWICLCQTTTPTSIPIKIAIEGLEANVVFKPKPSSFWITVRTGHQNPPPPKKKTTALQAKSTPFPPHRTLRLRAPPGLASCCRTSPWSPLKERSKTSGIDRTGASGFWEWSSPRFFSKAKGKAIFEEAVTNKAKWWVFLWKSRVI